MNVGSNPGAWVILALTCITSLYALYAAPRLLSECAFRPAEFWPKRQFDTLYLSGFVHMHVPHLLLNMVTFCFFAFPLERRMGTAAFVSLYFLALMMSLVLTWLRHHRHPGYACLGASGGVVAAVFAFIVYFPTATMIILPIPVPIPAPLFGVAYLGYCLYASKRLSDGVNHDAHLSGALWGILFVALTDHAAIERFFRYLS